MAAPQDVHYVKAWHIKREGGAAVPGLHALAGQAHGARTFPKVELQYTLRIVSAVGYGKRGFATR